MVEVSWCIHVEEMTLPGSYQWAVKRNVEKSVREYCKYFTLIFTHAEIISPAPQPELTGETPESATCNIFVLFSVEDKKSALDGREIYGQCIRLKTTGIPDWYHVGFQYHEQIPMSHMFWLENEEELGAYEKNPESWNVIAQDAAKRTGLSRLAAISRERQPAPRDGDHGQGGAFFDPYITESEVFDLIDSRGLNSDKHGIGRNIRYLDYPKAFEDLLQAGISPSKLEYHILRLDKSGINWRSTLEKQNVFFERNPVAASRKIFEM